MTENHLEKELPYTSKISQTQILDTDSIVPSQLSEKSSFIGVHVSPDIKIKFFLYNGTVQAEVSGINDLVSVELPEIPSEYSPRSITTEVKQLLRNFHSRPVYQSQPAMKVCFQSIEPERKTWKKQDNVLSLPAHSIWICRRNNTISYAYATTVITWDWTSDTFTSTSYEATNITALAENAGGDLVVGDERGQLFISDKPLFTGKKTSIRKIIYLCCNFCLIQFEDSGVSVFDIKLKEPICNETADGQKLTLLDNGMLVRWHENVMNVLRFEPSFKRYENLITQNYPSIRDIHSIPNAKFLIAHDDKTGTLWDVRKTHHGSPKNSYVSVFNNHIIGQDLLVLDDETLVYGKMTGSNVQLAFRAENDQKPIYADSAGFWGIDAMIVLSDGSIMYATRPTGSGIHVVTRDGKIVFTKHDEEFLNNKVVNLLKELGDGSVAVECSQSIFILKPQMLIVTENVDYAIELRKLKLRHNPTDLELYSELAKLYIEKNQSDRKLYQLYLSGLEAAIKSNHLYKARRFYEKARQIQPNSEEPCQTFMSYLEITPYKQLTRRIRLDLVALTTDVGNLSDNLKNRRCKTRLLVGEGDFSYTEGLIKKHEVTHPTLSKAIIATDLTATHWNYSQIEENKLKRRILDLKQRGVNVLFGVDAEQIHRIFKGRRFKRIQWNCPFGEATQTAIEKFKNTVPRFFQSCSQLQLPDDRVHITLMQKSDTYWKTRQKENPIVLGSAEAGYRLIRKRSFKPYGKERYPEYRHVKTGTTEKYSSGGEEQEFIFEKTHTVFAKATLSQAYKLMDPHKKKYNIESDNRDEQNPLLEDSYFVCSTDEDSSDYYESDSDGEL